MRIELLADLAFVLVVFLYVLHCDSERLVVDVFHMALQVELRSEDLWALVAGKDDLFFLFFYDQFRVLRDGNLDLLVLLLFWLHVRLNLCIYCRGLHWCSNHLHLRSRYLQL